MKRMIFFLLLFLIVQGCNSQKKQTPENSAGKWQQTTDTSNNPKVDIRVNKKYDDKGNLIEYDSSYSYFYRSGGVTRQVNADSLFSDFQRQFHMRYDNFLDKRFNSIFFNDTLYKYDFLNPDYFDRRFELNKKLFGDFFREMDSLKTEMLKHDFPEGEIRKNKN